MNPLTKISTFIKKSTFSTKGEQRLPLNKTIVDKASRLLKPLCHGPDFSFYFMCYETPVIKTDPPLNKTTFRLYTCLFVSLSTVYT